MKYIEYKILYSFDHLNYNRLDPFYDSPTFFLYLTHINYARRRPFTYRLIYRLLFLMKTVGYVPLDFFYQVFSLFKINIKTVHIKIAGRPHNIPVPITTNTGYSLLIRYFINGAHSQIDNRYEQRILAEFEAVVYYIGKSYGVLTMEKMFEQAKEDHIFAHYRWR